jgi:hypothetical protein
VPPTRLASLFAGSALPRRFPRAPNATRFALRGLGFASPVPACPQRDPGPKRFRFALRGLGFASPVSAPQAFRFALRGLGFASPVSAPPTRFASLSAGFGFASPVPAPQAFRFARRALRLCFSVLAASCGTADFESVGEARLQRRLRRAREPLAAAGRAARSFPRARTKSQRPVTILTGGSVLEGRAPTSVSTERPKKSSTPRNDPYWPGPSFSGPRGRVRPGERPKKSSTPSNDPYWRS